MLRGRVLAMRCAVLLGLAVTLCACVPDAAPPYEGARDMSERQKLGILCEAQLALYGTFSMSMAKPDDVSGCWPVGVWRFTSRLQANDCDQAPSLEPEYSFQVTRDEDSVETYQYLNTPGYERVRMKVTSGGGGLCEGALQLFSPDGTTVVNFKPSLHEDLSIDGFGEYAIFESDQW